MRFGHLAILAAVSPLAAQTFTAAAFSATGGGVISTARRNHAAAFVVSVSPPAFPSSSDLRMVDSSSDSGDDWYSDFNPEEYGRYNNNDDSWGSGGGYNDRGGGGGGGGRGGGGYGRRGGNRGSGYTRDTSRDNSEVDVETVESMLAERSDAKRRRDYDVADSIRDQLLQEFRVGVYDKDRTWRTGASTSGSRMTLRDGGRGGDRRGGRGMRREKDFGPNGHDYERSMDAGEHTASLDESEIHAMIAERLQAKLNRKFDVADRIQYELVDAGVFVHDKMKEWRSDGVPFGDLESGRGGRGGGGRNDRNRPYIKSAHSDDLNDPDLESQVDDMVAKRTFCKMNRDYGEADRIRDELVDDYNIFIDDRIREWSVGGDFGEDANQSRAMASSMQNRGYLKSEGSANLPSAEDEAYVQGKIDERSDAKSNRDYSLADSIRDELRMEYDVHIDDRARAWSVGGDFGGGGGRHARDEGYFCKGRGNLSDEDVAIIESMLTERTEAKMDRDFDAADAIRDELRNNYDVAVDDRKKEWQVDNDEYVQLSPEEGAASLDPADVTFIEARLSERFVLKKDRNYDKADEIRDQLSQEFGVYINDRSKEWRVERREFTEAQGEEYGDGGDDMSSLAVDEELDGDLDSIFEAESSDDAGEDEEASAVVSEAEKEDISEAKEESSIDVVSMEDLSSLTVVQLKEKLREVGKPVSGRKGELIERLMA